MVLIGQIMGLDEGDAGGACRDAVDIAVDAVDQPAGEEEIGRDDDLPVAELQRHFEPAADGGKGDARIDRLRPAEAEIFRHNAGQPGGLGIGQRVGGATADDDEHRVVKIAVMDMVAPERLEDAGLEGGDHLRVQAELAAIIDRQPRVLLLIGGQHRGDVVPGVGRGKEHAGHGEDPRHAGIAQRIEPHMDVGGGIFEKAVFDRHIGKARAQALGQKGEFLLGGLGAAAVAADHDTGL